MKTFKDNTATIPAASMTAEGIPLYDARAWTRIGGTAGVLGGVLGLVFNLLHPQADDIEDTLAQVQLVADSDIWVLDHILLMFGVLLVTGFVVASSEPSPPGGPHHGPGSASSSRSSQPPRWSY